MNDAKKILSLCALVNDDLHYVKILGDVIGHVSIRNRGRVKFKLAN